MNRIASYVTPFICGVGLTIGLIVLSGATKPQEETSALNTQVVSVAGGAVVLLAINDHNKNQLYLYKLPSADEEGNAKLLANIDLASAGKDELPAKISLD